MEEKRRIKPWYETPIVWCQTNLTEADEDMENLDFWKNYWKENQIGGVIINCSGIVTFYRSEKGKKGQSGFHGSSDCFGRWNQAARESGLAVIARMDMNVTEENQEEDHPDWYCRDERGSIIMSQGRYVTCINGGYYRQWIPSVMKEVIETYGPDGFADNNWSGLRRDTICYCDNCRKKFRERYGKELPKAHDWDDPVYRQWVSWGYDTRVELWDFFNQITREYGGEDCLWMGMLNGDPIRTRGQFYDIRRLVSRSKMVFLDNQSREAEGGFEENLIHGSLVHGLMDDSRMVAESMGQYFRGQRAFRLSCAAAGEARIWSLTGISGGISPWYHFIGAGTLDKRKFSLAPDILKWYRENKTMVTGRRNKANIALLWNQETFIYYGQSEVMERCAYSWLGFARAMAQSGIPFIPVHTMEIDRYKDRIDTYVIPNLAVMSDEETRTVTKEIKAGKNMVITGASGSRGPLGEKRENNPLLSAVGLEDQKENIGCKEAGTSDWSWHKAHNYLRVIRENHPLFEGLEGASILPLGGQVRVVADAGPWCVDAPSGCVRQSMEKLAVYIPEIPIYPPEFSWISAQTDTGGIFAGRGPEGSRLVYLAADIDRCYGKYGMPDHKKLLVNAVLFAGQGRLAARVRGDGEFCVSVYEKDENLLIHVVNLTGCRTMPGTQEKAAGVYGLTMEVMVSGTVKDVCGMVEKREYPFEEREGNLKIRIPKLGEHELFVVKREDFIK